MRNENIRIAWVDAIKDFAILCVVIGHAVNGYMDAGCFLEKADVMGMIYNVIYSFHMPLFFIMSGYLFNKAYVTADTLNMPRYKRQLFNLLLLYILYSVLLGLSKMAFSGMVSNKVQSGDILMIWAKPIQLYWYLYVLIMLYVLFGFGWIRNRSPHILAPILLLLSVTVSFISLGSWFQIKRTIYYALYFYIGMHLDALTDSTKLRLPGGVLAGAAVLAVIIFCKKKYLNTTPILNVVVALGLSWFLICLFKRQTCVADAKLFQFCGKYNLEIYLIHTFVLTASRKLLPMMGIDRFALNLFVDVMAGIGIPAAIGVAAKNLGLYNLLFRPAKLICGGSE